MSGGYFDHNQYYLQDIADQIERLIETNEKKDEYGYARNFSKETLELFHTAKQYLIASTIMVKRIDWLVSGDDDEKSFQERWGKEVMDWYRGVCRVDWMDKEEEK